MSSLAELLANKERVEKELHELFVQAENEGGQIDTIEYQELQELLREIVEKIKNLKAQPKKSGRRKTKKVKRKHSRRRK